LPDRHPDNGGPDRRWGQPEGVTSKVTAHVIPTIMRSRPLYALVVAGDSSSRTWFQTDLMRTDADVRMRVLDMRVAHGRQ
jgi:hypothetical protein